jgi:hypothetical protein
LVSVLVLGALALSACDSADQSEAVGTDESEISLASVARPLNGQMLLAPCLRDTQAAVCATVNGACPPPGSDPALNGAHLTDKSITLGGRPGHSYTIKLHI